MTGAVPPSIGGITLEREVRSSGVLLVHEGTDQLGLAVRAHLVPTSAFTSRFSEQDFLAAVRGAAAVRHEVLLGYSTGGVEGDWAYAVSKSPDARGLDEVLARGGGLAEERSLGVAAALCGALEALETNGLRHGALTPRRVLFPGRGAVLLRPPRILPVDLAPRRARYQSPEEARGEPGDVRSDLFVVGLILAECLTGEHPVGGGSKKVASRLARGKVRAAAEFAPNASAAAAAVLDRLLAIDPAARYPSAAAARVALEAAQRGEVPAAEPSAAPIPVATPLDAERPETAPIGDLDIPTLTKPAHAPALEGPPPARRADAPAGDAHIPTLGGSTAGDDVKRQPGRLFLESRLGEAILEIDEDVYLGRPDDALDIQARPTLFDAAVVRVERTRTADVLHALSGTVLVNDAPVDSWELKSGDRLAAGPIAGRYERGARAALRATGAGAGREPPPGARLAKAVVVVVGLACVGILAWAVTTGMEAFRPIEDARSALATAEQRLEADRRALATRKATADPHAPARRERAAHDMLERAREWARAHPDDPDGATEAFREIAKRYEQTASAILAEREIVAVGKRERARGDQEVEKLISEAHAEASEGRLDAALQLLRRYTDDHEGTVRAERTRRAAVEIENRIGARFRVDIKKIDDAIARRDWRVALNVLDRVMDYVPWGEMRDTAQARGRAVKAAMEGVSSTGATTKQPPGGKPPATPPSTPPTGGNGGGSAAGSGKKPDAPGAGDDAQKREEEAKAAFTAARRLMNSKKGEEAIRAFVAFMRAYKGTPTAEKRDREVRARLRSLVAEPAGIPALFRGKTEKQKGDVFRISYDFEDEEQLLDFRDVNAFEAPPRAQWEVVAGAVRTKGSGALVLDATFTSEAVSVQVTVTPERPHDLGIMLLEPGEPRRHYLFTLQNSFFKLGKGPDEALFRGHAVVLFGPGMWRDTPPDQLGFVKKCGTDEPDVVKGTPIRIKGGKEDAAVWMQFPGGKRIRGSAYGDVKYEFKGFEAAVFVLNSGGYFDDIVFEGALNRDWVKERWDAIIEGL